MAALLIIGEPLLKYPSFLNSQEIVFFPSLFASESCLHHIGKLSHGAVSLGQQVAFWWSIYSQIQSKKKNYSPELFTDRGIVADSFCDAIVVQTHQREFDSLFYRMFGEYPSSSLQYSCRYKYGLILYHSMAYKRKGKCASQMVCVEANSNCVDSIQSYGEIVYFFSFGNQAFFLFKQWQRSKKLFSSLIRPMKSIPKWSTYIDKYYPVVRSSDWRMKIFPCSAIICKCILLPIDKEFSVCTPLELETEHDWTWRNLLLSEISRLVLDRSSRSQSVKLNQVNMFFFPL